MNKAHPNSTHPVIRRLNALVYATFKPVWRHGSWGYGRLYYYGDSLIGGTPEVFDPRNPAWMLDGMTPVGYVCVLSCLADAGVKESRLKPFVDFFSLEEKKAVKRAHRAEMLRRSAAAKLTKAERKAVGLAQ